MRPTLKPALRRLWRDESTLQIGVDPRTALVLTGMGRTETRLLDVLDGAHDERDVLIAAAVLGVPHDAAQRLIATLNQAGVLDDGSSAAALAELPWAERARLAPDLAGLTLGHREVGAGVAAFQARQRSAVTVVGGGRLGAQIAALLAAAAIGHVGVDDPTATVIADAAPGGVRAGDAGLPRERAAEAAVRRAAPSTGSGPLVDGRRADLTILADRVPGRAEHDALLRDGQPHLYAAVRETTGVVGPFVLPGASPCLRCCDLTRAERDPAWPAVAAQLTLPSEARAEACDVILAAAVAAHTAAQATEFLQRPADADESPATAGGTLEFAPPDWRIRRRSWPFHPACGCDWPH